MYHARGKATFWLIQPQQLARPSTVPGPDTVRAVIETPATPVETRSQLNGAFG
jgi:hypothetical protein